MHQPMSLVVREGCCTWSMGLMHNPARVCAGGLGIRTRVTRRSQAQPGDPGRLDTSEFFEQAQRPRWCCWGIDSKAWAAV